MRVLYVSLVILIVDQLTKLFVKGFSIPFLNLRFEGLNYAEKHNIIGSFLRITFVENPGMAFGIDVGLSSKLFLSLFSVAASIGIVYYLYKVRTEDIKLRLSLALILGGALGNFIDRAFYGLFYGYAPLFYGKVVDFIDVDFFDISLFGYAYDRWPIFNVADMAVTIGVIMLIVFSKNESRATDTASQPVTDPQTEPAAPRQSAAELNDINNPGKENGEPDNGKEIQV